MTNDSQLIAQTFHEMRLFCQDIALILQTGEAIFNRHGWVPETNNHCAYRVSSSIEQPRGWLPLRFFRYYIHPEHPRAVVYLAVLVILPEGREREEGMTYLTAGGLIYKHPKGWGRVISGKKKKLFHWHLVRQDAGFSGVPSWQEEPIKWPNECNTSEWIKVTAGVESAVTLGLPLHEIKNAAQIETRIIEPLLKEVAHAGGDAR